MFLVLREMKACTACSVMLRWLLIKLVCHEVFNISPSFLLSFEACTWFFMTLSHVRRVLWLVQRLFLQSLILRFFFTELQAQAIANEHPGTFAFGDLDFY